MDAAMQAELAAALRRALAEAGIGLYRGRKDRSGNVVGTDEVAAEEIAFSLVAKHGWYVRRIGTRQGRVLPFQIVE